MSEIDGRSKVARKKKVEAIPLPVSVPEPVVRRLSCSVVSRKGHREPPMPPVPPKGTCKWCAEEIYYPKRHRKAGERAMRRHWHPACGRARRLAMRGAWQRRALLKRDGGVCAGCQHNCQESGRPWEADHITPLWSVPADVTMEERDLYWGLQNLQTLCCDCHKAKCKAEAGQRAQIRANLATQSSQLKMAA